MELKVKLSARNTLNGKVVELKMGQTTSHVKIDIGGGQIVTASITNEAVDELKEGYALSALGNHDIGCLNHSPSLITHFEI